MTGFIPWGDSFLREIDIDSSIHTKDVAMGMLSMNKIASDNKQVCKEYIQLNPIGGYEAILWVATTGRVYMLIADDPDVLLGTSPYHLYQVYLAFDLIVAGDIYKGVVSLNSKGEHVFYIKRLISTSANIEAYKLPVIKQYEYIYNILKNHYEYDKQTNPFHIRPAPMFSNTFSHRSYIKNHYG